VSRGPRLNQPWRAGVAAGLLVLAALLVRLAVLAWSHGVITMVLPKNDVHPDLVSTRYVGSFIAGAFGLATIAALLVLAALRQLLLAVRTRSRRGGPPVHTVEPPPQPAPAAA